MVAMPGSIGFGVAYLNLAGLGQPVEESLQFLRFIPAAFLVMALPFSSIMLSNALKGALKEEGVCKRSLSSMPTLSVCPFLRWPGCLPR